MRAKFPVTGQPEVADATNEELVGAAGFEPATSCTPSKRASRATLRPEPGREVYRRGFGFQSETADRWDTQKLRRAAGVF